MNKSKVDQDGWLELNGREQKDYQGSFALPQFNVRIFSVARSDACHVKCAFTWMNADYTELGDL